MKKLFLAILLIIFILIPNKSYAALSVLQEANTIISNPERIYNLYNEMPITEVIANFSNNPEWEIVKNTINDTTKTQWIVIRHKQEQFDQFIIEIRIEGNPDSRYGHKYMVDNYTIAYMCKDKLNAERMKRIVVDGFNKIYGQSTIIQPYNVLHWSEPKWRIPNKEINKQMIDDMPVYIFSIIRNYSMYE